MAEPYSLWLARVTDTQNVPEHIRLDPWWQNFRAQVEARAQAAEADADRYKAALEDVYDAWVDSDAHNRCAPGDCVKCDATYAAYAEAVRARGETDERASKGF